MVDRLLVLRADAGEEIGIGHAMRLLALGQAWRAAGGRAVLAWSQCPGRVLERFEREGISPRSIQGRAGSDSDALETVSLARSAGGAVIALDGYHFDSAYLKILAESGARFLLLDDLGLAGACPASKILNQNFAARAAWYPDCRAEQLLIGPRYALLRREFRDRDCVRARGPARKLLITFGGADPLNATPRAMETAATLFEECVVIAGPANPHLSKLHELAAGLPGGCRFTILESVEDMSGWMAWADVAAAAAGSSALEMAAMGLAAVYVATSDNQEMVGRGVEEAGVGVYAGRIPESWDEFAARLRQLAEDARLRDMLGCRGREIVDGRGAARVAEELCGLLAA